MKHHVDQLVWLAAIETGACDSHHLGRFDHDFLSTRFRALKGALEENKRLTTVEFWVILSDLLIERARLRETGPRRHLLPPAYS
jgi:hypothetical protein